MDTSLRLLRLLVAAGPSTDSPRRCRALRRARTVLAESLLDRPEFRRHVDDRRFRNPDTGNRVLYDSLPGPEQRRIYLEWWRGQRRERQKSEQTPPDPRRLRELRDAAERTNPWALPLHEHLERTLEGAGKRSHSSSDIKNPTVEELAWLGPPDPEKHVRIGKINLGGTDVSFHRSTKPQKFVKKDEQGEIVRGPDGRATYLDEDEQLARGLPLFETSVVAHVGDTPVGFVADEWGGTMLQVAQEHQRKGIGKLLTKIWRGAFPFKGSGGFTPAGRKTFANYHRDLVSHALSQGHLDRAVEQGWMSPDRFREILTSVGLDPAGNVVGEPRTSPEDLSGTPELRALRRQLARAFDLVRQNERAGKEDPEALAAARSLLSRARDMEDEQREEREAQTRRRQNNLHELAALYWKARQRGDEDEARRIWKQMDDV